jgi:hypothetical protein
VDVVASEHGDNIALPCPDHREPPRPNYDNHSRAADQELLEF